MEIDKKLITESVGRLLELCKGYEEYDDRLIAMGSLGGAWIAEYAMCGVDKAMNFLCFIEENPISIEHIKELETASCKNPYLLTKSIMEGTYNKVYCVQCGGVGNCPTFSESVRRRLLLAVGLSFEEEDVADDEVCPHCARCYMCHETPESESPAIRADALAQEISQFIATLPPPDLNS